MDLNGHSITRMKLDMDRYPVVIQTNPPNIQLARAHPNDLKIFIRVYFRLATNEIFQEIQDGFRNSCILNPEGHWCTDTDFKSEILDTEGIRYTGYNLRKIIDSDCYWMMIFDTETVPIGIEKTPDDRFLYIWFLDTAEGKAVYEKESKGNTISHVAKQLPYYLEEARYQQPGVTELPLALLAKLIFFRMDDGNA